MPMPLPRCTRRVLHLFWLLLWALAAIVSCRKADPSAPDTSPSAPSSVPVPPADSAAPSASPPEPAGSPAFLWKIERNKPAFVFGTIHIPDDRLNAVEVRMRRLASESDLVLTEIPMDPATQVRMSPMLMLPRGKTLANVVPRDVLSRVEQSFAAKGLPFGPLSTLKPWVMAVQLTMLDRLLVMAQRQPLDAVIFEAGKAAEGLETPEEQVAAFDVLSRDEQVHMLRSTLDLIDRYKKQGRDPVEELLVPYAGGDELRLSAAIMNSYDPKDPIDAKMIKRLFEDRNKRFADRIHLRLQAEEGKSVLIAIGAGHLVGPGSVIDLLEKKGLRVQRVR